MTLKRRFGKRMQKNRAIWKASLIEAQHKLKDNHPAMAIFLGKNYLDQSDKQTIETHQEASDVPKGEEKAVKAAAEAYKRTMAIRPYKTGS